MERVEIKEKKIKIFQCDLFFLASVELLSLQVKALFIKNSKLTAKVEFIKMRRLEDIDSIEKTENDNKTSPISPYIE